MIRRLLFSIIYFFSPIVLVSVIYHADTETYSDPMLALSMITGACAYTWLILEFVLIARAKFIERSFGQDVLYRFHGIMAIVSVIFIFAHKLIKDSIYGKMPVGEVGEKALVLYIAVCAFAILFMADTIIQKIKWISMFRKSMEKIHIAKYEYQVALHNLTVIALVVMFIHVMQSSSAEAYKSVKYAYIFYFAFGAAFYIYHKIIKRIILSRHSYRIKEIKPETPVMWTLKLVPEKGPVFEYKPGQFGFWRIIGKGFPREEHPFSLSSDPSEKNFITVTVKSLGDFTSRISEIKKEFKVYIDAPYGKFSYLDYPAETGIVLIAGGVGITPALSMLRYIRANDKDRKVMLLWGVRDQNELICRDEFSQMQKDMKNFSYVPVMFSDDKWSGEHGVINQEKIGRLMSDNKFDFKTSGFYICGPAPMLNAVLKSLKALKVRKKQIHYERFSI